MKYKVFVYAVFHKSFEVEANSQLEAMEAGERRYCDDSRPREGWEDAEELAGFLVDEVGDTEYRLSRNYDGDKASDFCDLCTRRVPRERHVKKTFKPVQRTVADTKWQLCQRCGDLPDSQIGARIITWRERRAIALAT